MIQVQNLTFTYPKSTQQVLKGIDFSIENGEVFGFLGPSGAGKSTAQKVLYKILTGYGGDIIIEHKKLKEWGAEYLNKIGVGFELPNHYLKLTGKENLQLFASFYEGRQFIPMEELFEMVNLKDAMNQPVSAYSKGMKMRLNFIRAIQHNPDILFFDEPTSGLDPVNAHLIKQHILDLKARGKTIFVTTHSMEAANDICDRVSFIIDGKLAATDSPENLKSKYGKAAVKVELQSGEAQEFPLPALGDNKDFLNFIKGKEVNRIHTMEASLEEVFIQITGQSLKA